MKAAEMLPSLSEMLMYSFLSAKVQMFAYKCQFDAFSAAVFSDLQDILSPFGGRGGQTQRDEAGGRRSVGEECNQIKIHLS